MAGKHKVEIFSAGCPICLGIIKAVRRVANSSCEVIVHDMRDKQIAQRAEDLGIRSVPGVVIDGKLASSCIDSGVDLEMLKCDLGDGCER
jgi:hypothetical protein